MTKRLEDRIFFDELAMELTGIIMTKGGNAAVAYSGSPSNPAFVRKSPTGINVGIHIDAGDNISICIINRGESALLYSSMDVVSRLTDTIGKAYSKGVRRSAYAAMRKE